MICLLMDSTSLLDSASSSALGSQRRVVVVAMFPCSLAINAGRVIHGGRKGVGVSAGIKPAWSSG